VRLRRTGAAQGFGVSKGRDQDAMPVYDAYQQKCNDENDGYLRNILPILYKYFLMKKS
jgi:hypothetical protein